MLAARPWWGSAIPGPAVLAAAVAKIDGKLLLGGWVCARWGPFCLLPLCLPLLRWFAEAHRLRRTACIPASWQMAATRADSV